MKKCWYSCWLLVALLLCSMLVTPALAAEGVKAPAGIVTGEKDEITYVDFSKFKDIAGHWAYDSLQWAVKNGIMAGTSATTMSPNGPITRAQMATMIVRAFGATKAADISMFADVHKDDWCYDSIAKAVQMGFLSGFGNAIAPNEAINRQEVAVSLVKAAGYTLTSSGNVNGYKDSGSIDSWATQYMSTAIANGLMNGYSDGRLAPKDGVTRAQFVTMLRRVAEAYMTSNATYTSKTVNGSLMVGVGNISLDNMTISGNLFLTDGVGTGDITLDGTTVNGTIYVRGTGPNTVKLTNRSHANIVVLCNPNNAVHLDVDKSSAINGVSVQEATGSVTLSGDVGTINVLTSKAPIKLTEAVAGNIVVSTKLAALSVDKGSEVGDIRIASAANGSTIELNGKAEDLIIDGSEVGLTINGSASSLDVNGENAKIDVKGALRSLSFGDAGDGCKLTLSKDCVIKTLDIDADKLKLTLAGKLTTVNLSGDDCDISFGGSTEIDTLNIDGDDNDVDFASGCKVSRVYTSGVDLKLTGRGTVKRIDVEKGKNIDIEIPGAEVRNRNGSNVYVGKTSVSRGSTVTVNSSGSSTVEADEEERQQNQNNNNNPSKPGGNTDKPSGGGTTDKPSGDADKPTPPKVDPINITVSLQNATEAQPSDFGYGSAYSLASFGTGFWYDETSKSLNGTVKYIEDFKWYTDYSGNQSYATGYYVPLVLQSSITSTAGELKVGDAMFFQDVISQGTGYNNYWIVYLALDPSASTKTITVTYDPDGSGTTYNSNSVTVDYASVQFKGGDAENILYDSTTAMPGVNGAETATITKMEDLVAEGNIHGFNLATTALLETKGDDGRYARTVGIRVPAFDDATFAKVNLVDPNGDVLYVENLSAVQGAEARYIDVPLKLTTDNRGSESQNWNVTITWYLNEETVSEHAVATILVNTSGCRFAGESATPSEKTPVVTDAVFVKSTLDEAELAGFVLNYNVTGTSVSGIVLGTGGKKDEYYLPIRITGTQNAAFDVYVDGTKLTTLTLDGDATEVAVTQNVRLTRVGNGVSDFKVELRPIDGDEAHTTTSFIVDTSAMTTASSALVLTGNVTSDSATYGRDLYYSLFNNMLTVDGIVLKQSDATVFGFDNAEPCWVVPVQFYVLTDVQDFAVLIDFAGAGTQKLTVADRGTDGLYTAYVPFAINKGDNAITAIQLVDTAKDNELITSAMVTFTGTLEGFQAPVGGWGVLG